MSGLVLRPFSPGDEEPARAAQEELAVDGFLFLLEEYDPAEPWSAYLDRLGHRSRGEDLPPDRVRADLLAAEAGGVLVGRASIRHELNDWLLAYGGHIGYGVRPAYRRRGHATAILRQSLARLAALGVDNALLTCDDGNTGSAIVIEACGGELENVVAGPEGEAPKRRYWIGTAAFAGEAPFAEEES